MKNLLIILCTLAILFFGGCAYMLGSDMLNVVPLAAIVLNSVALAYVWARKNAWPPIYYLFAVVDFALGGLGLFFIPLMLEFWVPLFWSLYICGIVLMFVKGVLTFYLA